MSRKIEIITLLIYHHGRVGETFWVTVISMIELLGGKNGYKGKLKATAISDVLYIFCQGNVSFSGKIWGI